MKALQKIQNEITTEKFPFKISKKKTNTTPINTNLSYKS